MAVVKLFILLWTNYYLNCKLLIPLYIFVHEFIVRLFGSAQVYFIKRFSTNGSDISNKTWLRIIHREVNAHLNNYFNILFANIYWID